MGRTLPWLQNEKQAKKPRASGPTVASSNTSREPRAKVRRSNRTPSTSPPRAPPPQERMRQGDEAWILVEDELLDTAKSYTRDLHVAEYQRLKSLAQRKRNEELESIRRPVNGTATMSADRKLAKLSEETRRLQKSKGHGTKRGSEDGKDDSDSEGSDMLIGDRNLAGLMLRSRDEQPQQSVLPPTLKTTSLKPSASLAHVPPTASTPKPQRQGKPSHNDKATGAEMTSNAAARSRSTHKNSVVPASRNVIATAVPSQANFDEPKVRRPIAPPKTRQEQSAQPKRRFSRSSSESEVERAPASQFKRPLKKFAPKEDSSRRRIQLDEIPLFLTG